MNSTVALNFFSDPGTADVTLKAGTLSKIGENLFRSLLEKENSAFGETGMGRTRSGNNIKGYGAAKETAMSGRGTKRESKAGSLSFLMDANLPGGLLKIAPTEAGRVMAFLQAQGVSREKAGTLLKSATDQDGFIDVARLLAGLAGFQETASGNGAIIAARDVPRVQEFLFRMGLGAGEVKNLSEESEDKEGNLILSNLSGKLAGTVPQASSPEKFAAFLAQYGIQSQQGEVAPEKDGSTVRALVQEYAETPSQDLQKHIKTVLGQLLQEKEGFAPEKVKSFLEGMNVTYAKEVSSPPSMNADRIFPGDGLVFKQQQKTLPDPWTEKILAILHGDTAETQQKSGKKGNLFPSLGSEETAVGKAGDKSLGHRLAALLSADRKISAVRGHEAPRGGGIDKETTFGPGGTLLKPSTQVSTGDRTVSSYQNGTLFARTLDYAQGSSPVAAILDKMHVMIKEGKHQATIQLSPPELGHLNLRLVMDQGHLQAHLATENPVVKELVEANLSQLKQQLAGLGFVVEEFSVQVGANGRDFSDQQKQFDKTEKFRISRLSGQAIAEPVSRDSSPVVTAGDERYQINVEV